MVDNSKSNIKDVSAGVPQGSRLGPLLFILYINDIIEDLESEVMIFADDTSLLATGKDPCETSDSGDFCVPADFLTSCDFNESLETIDSFESADCGETGHS